MGEIHILAVSPDRHEPTRRAYEAFGYERWPVARYFKPL